MKKGQINELAAKEKRVSELSKQLNSKIKACERAGIDPMEQPDVRAITDELNTIVESADTKLDIDAHEMQESDEQDQDDSESGVTEIDDAESEQRREDGEKPD